MPGLYYILRAYEYHEHAMHIAVGTSLMTIIFTGLSSAYAHYKKGAVDIPLMKGFLPGVLIGVGIGALMADQFSSPVLKGVFAGSQIFFGSYLLLRKNDLALFPAMPKQPLFSMVSTANSCLSALMGVGGGVQNVLFMTLCNVPLHRAIATAASIGPFIALVGATGYLFIGFDQEGLPPYNIGYINIIAFLTFISTSMLAAPLGAKCAHSLPVKKLKKYFSIFMLCVALKMLSEIYFEYNLQ